MLGLRTSALLLQNCLLAAVLVWVQKRNKMITKEQIEAIYNEVLEKPKTFHHLCYGGSTVKMVDVVSNEKHYTCRYQGDKNWMTPVCENCKGLDAANEELTDYQRSMNYGIDKLYNALLRSVANGS